MQKKLLPEAEQYAKQNNRRRIWRNFVRVMACIVVFCTTYALILPAITMEREPRCGLEEHIHTGKCYTQKTAEQVKKLACTYESLDVHVHDEQECYGEDKTLICGYADFLIHEHDASCVDEWGSLVCQLPEVKEHEHTQAECYRAVEMEPVSEVAEEVHENDDSSYTIASGELTCQIAEAKGHSHTQECYEAYLDENEVEQTKLICQETVVLEHTHSDSCYVVEEIPVDTETLTCGKEETEGHSHAEECYDENGELVCGLEEIEAHAHTDRCHGTWEMTCGYTVEHTHTLECYADKTADLETEATWTAGLPETTGTWRDDLLAIAKSQLGYKESEKNYIVEADGETLSGYNRYGAWYASVSGEDSYAYAPWNVTFLFFDLYHAGIGIGDFPYEEDCAAWIDSLSASELYRGAGEYAPNPGDLIFVDTDGDGEADRAGLVSEVLEDTVTVIEGDYDGAVTQVTYTLPALTAAEETAETTEATEAAEVTEINLNTSFTSIQLLSDGQDAETETTEAAEEPETVEAAVVGYADMLQAQLATVQVEETAPTVLANTWNAGDKLYLDVSKTLDASNGEGWYSSSAKFRLHYKAENHAEWIFSDVMKSVDGEDHLYYIEIPEDMILDNSAFLFARMNPNGTDVTTGKEGWSDDVWNKSSDLTLQANDNKYKITGWNESGQWDGWYRTNLAGLTLYLDKTAFAGDSYTIEYTVNGTTISEPLTLAAWDSNVWVYTFPSDSTADGSTQITIKDANGTPVSNFYWTDWSLDKVTSTNNVSPAEKYVRERMTIYFDATLSKLEILEEDSGDTGPKYQSLPNKADGKLYYCAKATDGSYTSGHMSEADSGNWTDVYSVTLGTDGKEYTQIQFSGYGISSFVNEAVRGKVTPILDIPQNFSRPCFYADSSDDSIYKDANDCYRKGYWDEAYQIRDAEAGKGKPVVDIASTTTSKSSDTLYVNTTLYDFYSDYELNGFNRDDYPTTSDSAHRFFQSSRHFNLALSSYYSDNSASRPLYWGHFQNDTADGKWFQTISPTLNYYKFNVVDSDDWNQSFYDNNSAIDLKGADTFEGVSAVQGLVSGKLDTNGNLMIETDRVDADQKTITVAAPYFNESFLAGNNALNTKLAKVYKDVSFPFVKVPLESESDPDATGTVDYWYFDSKDTDKANSNLQLRSSSDGYVLESAGEGTTNAIYGSSDLAGYFPFNTSEQSEDYVNLNYGFGQKFEIKFRLTDDGQVTTNLNEEVPIEFNFAGDDDVWVFIDNYLVLDVGGGHGPVTGRINFKAKEAVVNSVKKGNIAESVTTSFPDELKKDSDNNGICDLYEKEHTLTMFYMERGLWESNMKITFNFPDENILEVEKKVDDDAVNPLFQGMFDDEEMFTFNIKTLATHFGTQAVTDNSTGQKDPVTLDEKAGNDITLSSCSGVSFSNNAEHAATGNADEQIRWRIYGDDSVYTSSRASRYGQIKLNNNKQFSLAGYQYLEFEMWFNWNETPSLSYLFLDLVDSDGTTLLTSANMSANKALEGTVTMAQDTWIKVRLDLSKMVKPEYVDGSYDPDLAAIRIGYDKNRNVYIRNINFVPTTVVSNNITGFVMPQNAIPDYGTASTGELKVPEKAVYTSSDGNSYRIDSTGQFTLHHGESVTFSDQFRRGSYIYLSENTSYLYDTTWSMFEGRNNTSVSTNAFTNSSSTVTVKESKAMQNRSDQINVGTEEDQEWVTVVTDGRVEKAQSLGNGDAIEYEDSVPKESTKNKYRDTGSSDAPGNTFVFRHYSAPDDTSTTTKLKVVFTNKINVSTLTITKAQAGGSEEELTGEYTFYVKFYNVGGMGVEDAKRSTEASEYIVGPITLKKGESETITGIPVGTQFTIHEVDLPDGVIMETANQTTVPYTSTVDGKTSYAVDGVIPTDGTDVSYTIENSKRAYVDLKLKKTWLNSSGTEVTNEPHDIYVKLQRSTDGKTWTDVSVYSNVRISSADWSKEYTFSDLYKNDADSKQEYKYRVVELSGDNGTVLETGNTVTIDGTEYTVTYGAATLSDEVWSQTITNQEKVLKLQITKKTTKPENGVETIPGIKFTLTKGETTLEATTNAEGIATFSGLTAGTYELVEVLTEDQAKLYAPAGPWTITVTESNGTFTIAGSDGLTVSSTNDKLLYTTTIYNTPWGYELPDTGGTGTYLYTLGGIVLMALPLLYGYNQWRKRERRAAR